MTFLYWDCSAGIAGNMAVASLLDLGIPVEELKKALNRLSFPEGPLSLVFETRMKQGIRASYFNTADDEKVHEKKGGKGAKHSGHEKSDHDHTHDHAQDHNDARNHDHDHDHDHDHGHEHPSRPKSHAPDSDRGFAAICALIKKSGLPSEVQERAVRCFEVLGEAEASIHGTTIEKIHFHEVGARDSIADIVATCFCVCELGVKDVWVSPVNVGNGWVNCQHGKLPVPAPATAALLRGYPVFSLPETVGELTTPTGAALLRGFDAKPGMPPHMAYQKIGYGAGSKELSFPNVLRAFLGAGTSTGRTIEQVVVLETNLDNVTGELLGHVIGRVMEEGALDVTATPTQMKKGRPAVILSVMASPGTADRLEDLLFQELPTLGVRRQQLQRSILDRHPTDLTTPYGLMRGKCIIEADGTRREVPEFEAIRETAEKFNKPFRFVQDCLHGARKKQ